VILTGDTVPGEVPAEDDFPAPSGRAQPGDRGPKLNPHNPFALIGGAKARSGAGIAADFRPVFARFRAGLQLVSPVPGRYFKSFSRKAMWEQ
jgi:hypothetical protein